MFPSWRKPSADRRIDSRKAVPWTPRPPNTNTGTLRRRRQELVVSGHARHHRPGRRSTSASSTARPGCSPTIPASPRRQPASPRSPISTATRACCSIAATRSSSWPSTATSSRPATCCSTASCRPPAQKTDFDYRVTRHTMVHEQMTRFFQGFRRDAHPMAVMVGCVGALSAFYHDSTDISDPHQRMIASIRMIAKMPTHRGDGLQVFDRPAVHLSEERPRLHLELPAHVLRGAVRGLQGQPGPGPGAWTASSSCTPTTSRTPRPRRCGSPAPPAPTRSPASPPASPACGARRTAAPTRRR